MSERLVGFLGTFVGNDLLFQRATGFCPVFFPEAESKKLPTSVVAIYIPSLNH